MGRRPQAPGDTPSRLAESHDRAAGTATVALLYAAAHRTAEPARVLVEGAAPWRLIAGWVCLAVPAVLAVWLHRTMLGLASPEPREAVWWTVATAAGAVASFWAGRGAAAGLIAMRAGRTAPIDGRPRRLWTEHALGVAAASLAAWPGLAPVQLATVVLTSAALVGFRSMSRAEAEPPTAVRGSPG